MSAASMLAERLEQEHDVVRTSTRFATGMFPLDHVLGGGFRRQDLVMVTGRPGVGKTIMALQWARTIAKHGATAIYVCYEHSAETLLERLIALETACDHRERRSPSTPAAGALFSCDGRREVIERVQGYGERLVFVAASGRRTDIEAIDRLVVEQSGRDTVVFVDYLQKMPARGHDSNEDERTEYLAESLKDLAVTRDVAVVAIAGADKEALAARRMRMRHMRGSTALVYEADVALVLNEKSVAVSKMHLAYDAQRAESAKRSLVVSVEKNRNGAADVDLEFTKEFASFAIDPEGTFLAENLVDDVLYGE
jgi:replicative DNA helicase